MPGVAGGVECGCAGFQRGFFRVLRLVQAVLV